MLVHSASLRSLKRSAVARRVSGSLGRAERAGGTGGRTRTRNPASLLALRLSSLARPRSLAFWLFLVHVSNYIYYNHYHYPYYCYYYYYYYYYYYCYYS